MNFQTTKIPGLVLIERTASPDERGYFARLSCSREFREHGIAEDFVQSNLCLNRRRGTLRGLHFQKEKQEGKLVSCVSGRIWDVCVDLRKESETFLQYAAYELSEENQRMLYIPKGCAHGYLTLEDDSRLIYMMTEFYIPGNDGGYRYDDPAFGIPWQLPEKELILSEKDRNLPYYGDETHE